MSFLYPHTITITRPGVQTAFGAVATNGAAAETLIASGVAASIQFRKDAAKLDTNLPGDVSRRALWRILFNLPSGTVQNRDIIADETGNRYQVAANYWNSLGYNTQCELLEV